MFSRFFIDRPIFAAVLSIIITLVGGLSLLTLPLAQYPRIAPPNVNVTCNYPGADAKVVSESVAAPIEQFVIGVEGAMYMSSQCTNDGTYNLAVTFEQGVDVNMAQVLVQNKLNLALPSLPDVIKTTGITTRKRSPDILLVVCITSPQGRHDQLFLSNFALTKVKDELSRVEGVSDVFLFGQRDYSMRIWLDPDKLSYRDLTPGDVVKKLREQNLQIATGSIGQEPVAFGQQTQITIDVKGRLDTQEEYENVIVKSTPEGRMVRLKDVGRVTLGAKNQDVNIMLDNQPCCGLAMFQLPEANALDTADRCLVLMEKLKKNFPPDVNYVVSLNTTPYTRESLYEVIKTLRDAIILVALVVLTFLQNWRSAIIPLIAVPVAIIGTFAVMAAMGFSLNNLTLFGLVLAIGIVVDDAIVVVEAVEHHIEKGLKPRDATILAMQQVSGPVIAVGLVLSAVFVPCAFISGITGMFFRQFALTIAVSTIISAFNSLTLSPALAAMLLRPLHDNLEKPPPLPRLAFLPLGGLLGWAWLTPWLDVGWLWVKHHSADELLGWLNLVPDWALTASGVLDGVLLGWLLGGWLNRILNSGFRSFNNGFERVAVRYTGVIGHLLHRSKMAVAVYVGLLVLTAVGFFASPKGFIPAQDMGRLYVNVQLPDDASLERTMGVMRKTSEIILKHKVIDHVTAVGGQSFFLNAFGSNFGSMFVGMLNYSERSGANQSSDAVAAALQKEFNTQIPEAVVTVFGPSPVPGVGRAGGFAFVVEDREDLGPEVLQEQLENLMDKAKKLKGFDRVFSVFRANIPQIKVEVDAGEIKTRGVNTGDLTNTLSILHGSLYVNDFNLFGRVWQVNAQADSPFRTDAGTISQFKVRNSDKNMVPLGSLVSLRDITGPLILNRYNRYASATVQGMTGPELSSREGIDMMMKLADQELPRSMSYEWTDMSYLEVQAGNTAMAIFGFSVLMVFLVLAAQYESWSLPLAIILVVPLCMLSAIIGVRLRGMDINIFTQIGFVVLVGLASKNAILIVEFAKKEREAGTPGRAATLNACRLRLRPIIMTSLAFILGVLPLMVSHGAGAEMRRTLGTAVFSGMVGVTFFGIFLTPVFFFVINRYSESPEMNTPFMHDLRRVSLFVPRLAVRGVRDLVGYLRNGNGNGKH